MSKRVGLILKPNKIEAIELAKELTNWFNQRHVQVFLEERVASLINNSLACSRADMGRLIDFLIVLGGDGTLLSAVRDMTGKDIPILGVNLGGLGFLTEITLEELYPVLGQVLDGKMEIESRMKLKAQVVRGGEIIGEYTVLNDAVITKSVLARIINIKSSINGAYVTTYRGDGVIISTPTGSTAYSLAAGGPIVYPTLDSILITPICPHTLTNRPLLVPDRVKVEFKLESEESDVRLTLDGQVGCPLQPFDQILVSKAPDYVSFIRSPFKDYFQILRTKFKWGER